MRDRQVRGEALPCKYVPKGLESQLNAVQCYTYEKDAQDKTSFDMRNGQTWPTVSQSSSLTCAIVRFRYMWHSQDDLLGSDYSRGLAAYSGGGFIQDLPPSNGTAAAKIVNDLQVYSVGDYPLSCDNACHWWVAWWIGIRMDKQNDPSFLCGLCHI